MNYIDIPHDLYINLIKIANEQGMTVEELVDKILTKKIKELRNGIQDTERH